MKINQRNWLSRVGIVVIAAVLVGLISIVQYQRIRSIMEEEMSLRSRVTMASLQAEIGHRGVHHEGESLGGAPQPFPSRFRFLGHALFDRR